MIDKISVIRKIQESYYLSYISVKDRQDLFNKINNFDEAQLIELNFILDSEGGVLDQLNMELDTFFNKLEEDDVQIDLDIKTFKKSDLKSLEVEIRNKEANEYESLINNL